MTQLIVFRAMQGIGGSAIYSGVVVTISTIVPTVSKVLIRPASIAKYPIGNTWFLYVYYRNSFRHE